MIEIFKGGVICLGVTGRGEAELIKGEGIGTGVKAAFHPSKRGSVAPAIKRKKKRTASAADRCHVSASWVVRFPPTDHGRIAAVWS